MAKPPEALADELPKATWVVLAEVSEVLDAGPTKGGVRQVGATDVAPPVAAQRVRLKVTKVLLKPDAEDEASSLVAVKPEAPYALRVGNRGAFLLAATGDRLVILGRYGPDTWRVEAVEAALSR